MGGQDWLAPYAETWNWSGWNPYGGSTSSWSATGQIPREFLGVTTHP